MNLLEKFLAVRNRTEALCKPLETEDYIPQPAEFVSPTKWHLAHTTWFFEEMILAKFTAGYKRFHPDYAFLFNSYYNTIGARTQRDNRGAMTRPTVKQVFTFREAITNQIATNFNTLNQEALALLELGINHEQQHQELLLTDLKYTLAQNPTHPVYKQKGSLVNTKNNASGTITVVSGLYTVGFEGSTFCYDNEKNAHQVFVSDFEINKNLVTNAEYIEFIEQGGYTNFAFWLDEGWHWVNAEKREAPLYWQKIENEWYHFTLGGFQKVNPNEQLCHVNFFEADAFARFKNMRLPTEFEWEIASENLNWGTRWEWTNSAYLAYPGYKIAPGAVGEYNGKFMINQMVLRGASVATAKNHSRNTYRNFFHPHLQWQFSGIRLAK